MGIRRGDWNTGNINKVATVKTGRYGARPAPIAKEGVSNSEQYMRTRKLATNTEVVGGVSEHRQGDLIRASATAEAQSDPAPLVVHSNSYKSNKEMQQKYGMTKEATGVSVSDGSRLGGGSTVRQAPEVYSPLFQIANLQLPRERITMNAWNRNFYDTHPLVHNCINLHATYPINKINIKCKDRKVEQFFNDMAEELDLANILQAISLEFWKMGEVFPYTELDDKKGVWSDIVIQNPDYIHIKSSVLGGDEIISLRPDAALQALVHSNAPADLQLKQQIDEEIIYHIKKGNNIPLDNFHVSHLAMKSASYDIHGTSLIVSIYKDLMLYDKLRESKFAQADNLVNPITLVKVGGSAEGEYHPTPEALEKWRQTLEAAQYDKDFKIITHAGVDISRVGAAGQIIDINSDVEKILDNILFGLLTPKAVITQEGASFNSASVGLEVLKQRYEAFRNMMAQWLIKKVFGPISEMQQFYEYKDGDKKLIVPEVEWNRMILFDMDNYINVLSNLAQNKSVSKTTLFRSLGLSIDEEKRQIREELIGDAIMQKEMQILGGMSLGALRSIKPDEDIIEPTEAPLPGTPGAEEAGVPGAGGMGGGMGGGMPGAPPMGGGGLGGGGGSPLGGGGGSPLGGPPLGGPGGGDLGGPPLGGGAPGGAGGGGAPPVI